MNKKNFVSYVIGTFLSFPIRVYHLITPDDNSCKDDKKDNKSSQQTQLPKSQAITQKGKCYDQKRTCGHSQKDARAKRSKH